MELKTILQEYIDFLDRHRSRAPAAAHWCKLLKRELGTANYSGLSAAKHIVDLYGGMGSINDIVFYSENMKAYDKEANSKYRDINEQLYTICIDLIRNAK
jgi:hypothetical protein